MKVMWSATLLELKIDDNLEVKRDKKKAKCTKTKSSSLVRLMAITHVAFHREDKYKIRK